MRSKTRRFCSPSPNSRRRRAPLIVQVCRSVPTSAQPTVHAPATTSSERRVALNYRRSEARDFPLNVLRAGQPLLTDAARLRSWGVAAGGVGCPWLAEPACAGALGGRASRVRCGCGTAGRRSRTSMPWGTSVSSWRAASRSLGDRPSGDRCRTAGSSAAVPWGRVLVVVVGAAQPVGPGRDGLVFDPDGAAVWYRPVARMRHR
jgi:hypothetical protein